MRGELRSPERSCRKSHRCSFGRRCLGTPGASGFAFTPAFTFTSTASPPLRHAGSSVWDVTRTDYSLFTHSRLTSLIKLLKSRRKFNGAFRQADQELQKNNVQSVNVVSKVSMWWTRGSWSAFGSATPSKTLPRRSQAERHLLQ